MLPSLDSVTKKTAFGHSFMVQQMLEICEEQHEKDRNLHKKSNTTQNLASYIHGCPLTAALALRIMQVGKTLLSHQRMPLMSKIVD
jgi:hypothetical protein